MSWNKAEVEGNGCDKATKHDVLGRLMTKVTEMVAQKEAGAAALSGNHTPQEE